MEITVKDAARMLERDPRTVRNMIRRQQIPARKVGATYLVRLQDLPMSEAQRREAEKSLGRLRHVVDQALPSVPAVPSGSAAASERLIPGTTGEGGEGRGASRPYSLRLLKTFTTGVEVVEGFLDTRAEGDVEHNGFRKEVGPFLLEGLKTLAVAFYLFDARRKRESLEEARANFSRALTFLFLWRHRLMRHLTPSAEAGDPAPGTSLENVEKVIAALESEVMPGITGLLRRLEKGGSGHKGRAAQGGRT